MASLQIRFKNYFLQVAASGWVPRRFYLPTIPDWSNLPQRTGPLTIEIVSHCWNYSHLLAYQLSSLVLYPPQNITVRATVFHALEDRKSVELLKFFERHTPPNITWNWWPVGRSELFRRAIGRNRAALATDADWIWFTDCDQLFHRGCLDSLASQLQGRNDPLVFPRHVRCTPLLAEADGLIQAATESPALVEIDLDRFDQISHDRAIGALQIAHGDVARSIGYCNTIPLYQTPVDRWHKTREDRAFRWLVGSQGTPIDVPGIFRIEHVQKGRYGDHNQLNWARKSVRRWKSKAA